MQKVAILNFKGRTGKTTTAVNLGHVLSLKDFKILIIDCDPGFNIKLVWDRARIYHKY